MSTLYNFRSDDPDALPTQDLTSFSTLIHGVYPGSKIQFDTLSPRSNILTAGNSVLTKVDTVGKLFFYKYNINPPLKME